MKVVVTGAHGLLGSALCPELGRRWDVVPLGRRDCDVASADGVLRTLEACRPNVVVHLAAYTNVDGCELEPARAALVNAKGTDNVAIACQRLDLRLVYLSTDYVFEGRQATPYREDDPARPLSVYGKSKLAGEWFCRTRCTNLLVVRSAWLFGPGGRNFVSTIVDKADKGEPLSVVDDQCGSPTYTVDLARVLAGLIERGDTGIVHAVNSGQATWYDVAVEALRLRGVGVKVSRIKSSELGRPAARPAYSVLDASRLGRLGPMRDWREALADFLSGAPS